MKVRMLASMAGQGFALAPGDEFECDKDEAERLIGAGFAEAMAGPRKEAADAAPAMERAVAKPARERRAKAAD